GSAACRRILRCPRVIPLLMDRDTMPRGCRVIAVTALAALVCAGCSKTESAQARGRDDAAKRVKIELVRQEAVHRAVEVVGTLAAVDEVTVSSQAEAIGS